MRETASPLLSRMTTLRLGGRAIAELTLEGEADLEALPERVKRLGGRPYIVGAGSNILAADEELPLVIIRPLLRHGPEIVGSDAGKILVRAGAGIPLPRLLRFCAEKGLSGLEGLTGIPGSVGGAVAMNAGSFGSETCRNIERILVFSSLGLLRIGADQLRCGYRKLSLVGVEENFMVLEAIFGLTEAPRDGILNRMSFNFLQKKSRQPVTAKSAGCVFKNPSPEMPAGKLLEMAGFRGKTLGGMAFSSMHANFLVNADHGTARAAFDLLHEARETVRDRFDITLEPEVRIIPCRCF
ncbi:MAG: UDP-N-acetylmuramate dehydrogenase [Desulfovibrio sp.]|nr:UDP-N-acetylmuramate dehydrogenase [Desulfovibrio sp.]